MTGYTVAWGRDTTDPSGQRTARVETAEELDAVLDMIATTNDGPLIVDIYAGTWREGEPMTPTGMQLMWGHAERAALVWLGEGAGYAVDPSIDPWPEPIDHDLDEIGPHRTRLTPKAAREAVRGYVRTGSRPTGLEWVLS